MRVNEGSAMRYNLDYSSFNGKYIYDNKIGPGAIVQITRSGDVIPYIVKVIKPSPTGAQMPDIEYTWGKSEEAEETGEEIVDIYAINPGEIMCIKIMHHFFSTLGAKHVAFQTLKKIHSQGETTLIDVLKMKKADFMNIDGIEEKSAERIYTSIHKAITNVPMYQLMGASSIFGQGIGVRKMKVLLQSFPNIIQAYKKLSRDELFERINDIEGFSDITTNKIIANLPWFDKFLQKTKGIISIQEKKKATKQNLTGMKFVFSGFRNKEMEDDIEARGGAVTTSVSSKTSAVITNDKSQTTGKIAKARSLGLDVFTPDEFKKKYL